MGNFLGCIQEKAPGKTSFLFLKKEKERRGKKKEEGTERAFFFRVDKEKKT